MDSRDRAITGALFLMFFCLGSAHRLLLETREGDIATSGAPFQHESTTGFFVKPSDELVDIDTQLFETLAPETSGPLDDKEQKDGTPPTHPGFAENLIIEKQNGDPWFTDRKASEYDGTPPTHPGFARGPPSSPDRSGSAEGPINPWFTTRKTSNNGPPPSPDRPTSAQLPIRGSIFSPSEGVYGMEAYEPAPIDRVYANQEDDSFGDFTNIDPEFI